MYDPKMDILSSIRAEHFPKKWLKGFFLFWTTATNTFQKLQQQQGECLCGNVIIAQTL